MTGPLNGAKQNSAFVVGAVFNETVPAPADQQTCALQCDNEGNLLVNVASGGGSGSNPAAGPTGSPVPTDADYLGVNIGGTLQGVSTLNPVPTRPGTPTTTNYSHAVIAISGSGSASVIAAVAAQTIRIFKIQFTTTGATNIYFLDSTPAALSGVYTLIANGASYFDFFNGEPLYITASGKGFEINSSASVTIGGDVWYTQS